METTITLGAVIAILGATVGVIQYLKNRDKTNGDRERELTELKVRLDIYKEELDSLKNKVDILDTKLMDKVDNLSSKIDEIMLKLIDK